MPPKAPAPPLTHFLCLPLVTPSSYAQLQTSLSLFRDKVTQNCTPQNPDGVPRAAIRSFRTLHLTLGVMSLSTPERVERALKLLRELDLEKLIQPHHITSSSQGKGVEDTILEARTVVRSSPATQLATVTRTQERREIEAIPKDGNGGARLSGMSPTMGLAPIGPAEQGNIRTISPSSVTMVPPGTETEPPPLGTAPSSPSNLTITLKGLRSMSPNPNKTSVLYAPPTPNLDLETFCLKLRDAFRSADLLIPETRPLLLHATILNTVYVPNGGVEGSRRRERGHGKSRTRLTIDATEILEDWWDFEWMKDVKIKKVAICRMGAKKLPDETEEYVVEGSVDIT